MDCYHPTLGEWRKALFHWLSKDKVEIVFLQETYSSPDDFLFIIFSTKLRMYGWKTQWKGDLYFAHGSEHSRGVLILVKERLNFELKSCTHDTQGRYIILMGNVQEQPFVFVNIYAPNKSSEQCIFFQEIQTELDSLNIEADCDIITGGDFNVILDPEFDGLGGKPKLKESVKIIEQIRLSFNRHLACVSQNTRKLLGPENFSGLFSGEFLGSRKAFLNEPENTPDSHPSFSGCFLGFVART